MELEYSLFISGLVLLAISRASRDPTWDAEFAPYVRGFSEIL